MAEFMDQRPAGFVFSVGKTAQFFQAIGDKLGCLRVIDAAENRLGLFDDVLLLDECRVLLRLAHHGTEVVKILVVQDEADF